MPKIFLLGAMGAGKTTIGKLLSKELGYKYIDNDLELESLSNLSKSELSNLPVNQLHDWELKYLEMISNLDVDLIAGVAASVVDYPISRDYLKNSINIYLYLPLSKLQKRAGSSGIGRQALGVDGEKIITERFNRRDPIYREVSQFVLELSDDSSRDKDQIIEFLKDKI